MALEYRVVWKRESGRRHEARYATLRGAQRKALRLGPEPWLAAVERSKRDPNAVWCCAGYGCDCGGQTIQENWTEFMEGASPIVEGPRIEAREVGQWVEPSNEFAQNSNVEKP